MIYSVGINDADYKVRIKVEGSIQICPFYAKWHSMMTRCYSENFLKRCPTYKGCSVYEPWLKFTNFKKWMETQDWVGKELDKDLLVEGNSIYSPETCVFISQELNSFLTYKQKTNVTEYIGATRCGDKYRAVIKTETGHKHIGYFKTAKEAGKAWLVEKRKASIVLAEKQSNPVVKAALLNRFTSGEIAYVNP